MGCLFFVTPIATNLEKPQNINYSHLDPQFYPQDPKINEQNGLTDIDLPQAWDITTGSQDVVIAIIDDAIDIHHPDLSANISGGWDFVDNDSDPSPGNCFDPATQEPIEEKHGTSIAGIIGAVGNNQEGIAGVSWNVRLLPIRIGCTYSAALEAQAVSYAIAQGADIINASYAGADFLYRNENVLQQLTNAKNDVLFVTSAGNLHTNNDLFPMYPGNANLPNVISVAATNSNQQLVHWSQFGSYSVDLAAPGENLLTTIYDASNSSYYGTVSGTSFSTALVSGVAGLLSAQGLKAGDIKGALLASAKGLNRQQGYLKTDAILNAYNAVLNADNPKPVVIINRVKVKDELSSIPNEEIDANEAFHIQIELQNLWQDVSSIELELIPTNSHINTIENRVFSDFWEKNTNKAFSFSFLSGNFSGIENFSFILNIKANGVAKNVEYNRRFNIESGQLEHNQAVSDTIQKNFSDETQAWHFNIPAEANKVAIELERLATDDRKLGLLGDVGRRPQIFFKESASRPYTASSKYEIYSDKSYERIDFSIASLKAETIKLLVFNKARNLANENIISNKQYRIKACYFTENNSNKPPIVQAGSDITVNPGDEVILSGEIDDIDGQVVKYWWSTDSDINFSVNAANEVKFTAPQSGNIRFVLTAVDNDCSKSADSVNIIVNEENSGDVGLQINPKRIEIEEGSVISVQVNASYEGQPINDLRFITGPEGIIFEKTQSSDSFDRLIWQNTGSPGLYSVLFSANVNGNIVEGSIIIEISKRGSKGTGGGCTMNKSNEFDPVFFLYLMFSFLYIVNRKANL